MLAFYSNKLFLRRLGFCEWVIGLVIAAIELVHNSLSAAHPSIYRIFLVPWPIHYNRTMSMNSLLKYNYWINSKSDFYYVNIEYARDYWNGWLSSQFGDRCNPFQVWCTFAIRMNRSACTVSNESSQIVVRTIMFL